MRGTGLIIKKSVTSGKTQLIVRIDEDRYGFEVPPKMEPYVAKATEGSKVELIARHRVRHAGTHLYNNMQLQYIKLLS